MVSIIVPVYNVEKHLQKCINSILAQSHRDFELLLIDDGSTDTSGAICDNAAHSDSRVNVIHQKNRGCSAARNLGLTYAKGEYICFIDSDDYVVDNYLETLLSLLIEHNADISMCNYINVDLQGNELDKPHKKFYSDIKCFNPEEISKEVYGKLFVPYVVVWNKLYVRKIWENLRFTENLCCEDDAIVQKVYHLADKIVYKDTPLYYYVHNDKSIIHSYKNKVANIIDDMYGLYLHSFFLINNGEVEAAQEAFHCYFANGVQVLTLLKKETSTTHQGELITFNKFLRKFRFHYHGAKKEIKFKKKRQFYYTLFMCFPVITITFRSLKHKIHSKSK